MGASRERMGWNAGGMEPRELQEPRRREQLCITPPWGAEYPPHSLWAALGTRQGRTPCLRLTSRRTPGLSSRSLDMGLEGFWGKIHLVLVAMVFAQPGSLLPAVLMCHSSSAGLGDHPRCRYGPRGPDPGTSPPPEERVVLGTASVLRCPFCQAGCENKPQF